MFHNLVQGFGLIVVQDHGEQNFFFSSHKNPFYGLFIRIICKFVGRSDPFSCCPGKEAGAEAKKGREKPLGLPLLRFRKETRGPRNGRAETAAARVGEIGTTAFFGKAKAFLPGQGTPWL